MFLLVKEFLLFIIGPHKTGTSTLVRILNQHPNILILYETFLFYSTPRKYGKRFLGKYPNSRFLFRNSFDIEQLYNELRTFLNKKGFNFKIVGDKYPTIDGRVLELLKTKKIVLTIRDIKTWLCKDKIIRNYIHKEDIVPVAIDYSVFFLKSFLLKNIYRVRLEDLIFNTNEIIDNIGNFLQIPLKNYSRNWWNNTKQFNKENPKYFLKWQETHYSSSIEPKREDTVAKINQIPFWKKLLPIFYKYYNNINNKFEIPEIKRDIEIIRNLIKFSPLPMGKAYKMHKSSSFKEKKKIKGIIGNFLILLLKKIEKIIKKIFN